MLPDGRCLWTSTIFLPPPRLWAKLSYRFKVLAGVTPPPGKTSIGSVHKTGVAKCSNLGGVRSAVQAGEEKTRISGWGADMMNVDRADSCLIVIRLQFDFFWCGHGRVLYNWLCTCVCSYGRCFQFDESFWSFSSSKLFCFLLPYLHHLKIAPESVSNHIHFLFIFHFHFPSEKIKQFGTTLTVLKTGFTKVLALECCRM